jgi:hypothetical protein
MAKVLWLNLLPGGLSYSPIFGQISG